MSILHPATALGTADALSLTSHLAFDAASGELRGTERLHPLHCHLTLFYAPTDAEVIARDGGACFVFRTRLGTLPFTAAAPEIRQTLLGILQLLKHEMVGSDIDLSLSAESELILHGSSLSETTPTLAVFLTALTEFAQAARPYLLELRPLLASPPARVGRE